MNTIIKIMQAISPTGKAVDAEYVGRINNGSYMPLVLERIGNGPHNLPAFSLAHVSEQNGDTMYDPEVCFELSDNNKLHPYSYRNDYVGSMREVYLTRNGHRLVNVKEKRDQEIFLRQWAKNLKDQGFIEAAIAHVKEEDEPAYTDDERTNAESVYHS